MTPNPIYIQEVLLARDERIRLESLRAAVLSMNESASTVHLLERAEKFRTYIEEGKT